MNYLIVRILIPLFFILIEIYYYKKIKKISLDETKNVLKKDRVKIAEGNKMLLNQTIISCVFLFFFLAKRIDFEKDIIEFKTPFSAFNYTYPSAVVHHYIEKDNYTVFFYIDSDLKYQISQKYSNNNWSYILPNSLEKKTITTSKYNINIYSKNGLNFISITNPDYFENTNYIKINDNKNSIFESYDYQPEDNYFNINYRIYYAVVTDFNNYELFIDDKLIYSNL